MLDVTTQLAILDSAIAQAQVVAQQAQQASEQARNQLAALQEQRAAISAYAVRLPVTTLALDAAAIVVAGQTQLGAVSGPSTP